ncbi:MAG: U32 family peptidase [Lachnospiraceae bacterium]|nr:U32 family peptidase [Lachnospiraceae bacterium]
MKKTVELLAPAGNYEAFLGAVNAGADAVYLGGEKFGARAYAQNFTGEEICRAIRTAHFMGRKIYLTVNTLIKDTEFSELYSYLCPFYEAGLDGVIVQDLGALRYIGEYFPGLALHVSTQMTVTGLGGAAMLGRLGVERIVPARELSLDEVRRMKEETGLEIECFVHGAMCYCYSGQCLFSSILGGRSGNRGRCAQPCRLPYQICDGEERVKGIEYPISLKDMCTISFLPQLIEAGIDSFKIEGRMKKPEYAAGVTALYRKYIDLYERNGTDGYHVSKEDQDMLRSLYIRSEIQTGYYERHNGREMITLHKPSYAGSDQELLEQIASKYIREPDKHPVGMTVTLAVGEPVCLRIFDSETEGADTVNPAEEGLSITVYGAVAEAAKKMPLQPDHIKKQLLKTGNCCLTVTFCEIEIKGDVFLPVSALNDLRRKGIEAYERQYIIRQGMSAGRDPLSEAEPVRREASEGKETAGRGISANDICGEFSGSVSEITNRMIDIMVSTCDQLAVAVTFPCRRIYIDSDLYMTEHDRVVSLMRTHGDLQYALALPYVLRARDEAYLLELTDKVKKDCCDYETDTDLHSRQDGRRKCDTLISGFLVRNIEGFAYAATFGESYELIPDAGLYSFNTESLRFWADYTEEYTLPYELNRKESGKLVRSAKEMGMRTAMIVYGTIPMMVTANCIRKTAARCHTDRHGNSHSDLHLRDRYGTDFPVETNCLHCYNIIYNSIPYSLHMQENEVKRIGADIRRYDFTTESAQDCRRILTGEDFPYEAYTTGHLKRGVE